MAKSKIVTIEIELKDYEPIKFTMDEAKELYEQLDSLFGKKEVVHHHHKEWWYRPYITWTTNAGSNLCTDGVTYSNAANVLAGTQVSSSATQMKVSYQTN